MFSEQPRLRFALLPLIVVLLPAMVRAGASTDAQAPNASQGAVTRPLFDFHSDFWVNLHQVLLHEAWLKAGKPDRMLESAPPLSTVGMSKQEEADWNAAVSLYGARYGTRPQHDVDELINIDDTLAGQRDDGAHLDPAGLPRAIVQVLQSAAVVYRKRWWPAHNQSNEDWIASQKERVQGLGPKLAAAMTTDLQELWPAVPIRVDVCHYVVALGHAMTTTHPPHITFSSFDPSNQGISGFELLFHEASHAYADTLMRALSAEGVRQHKDVADLWHATLFYTSGVELRRLLPEAEQAGFAPYGYRYTVYKSRWAQYRHLLETDWQTYLDGRTNFDAAIRGMVTDLKP